MQLSKLKYLLCGPSSDCSVLTPAVPETPSTIRQKAVFQAAGILKNCFFSYVFLPQFIFAGEVHQTSSMNGRGENRDRGTRSRRVVDHNPCLAWSVCGHWSSRPCWTHSPLTTTQLSSMISEVCRVDNRRKHVSCPK